MNPDLTALYKQKYESLSDRLAKMDMAREGDTVGALQRVSVGNRVEGENPMTRIEAGTNISNTNSRARLQSMQMEWDMLTELTEKLKGNQQEPISPDKLIGLKLQAADKGYELVTNEDGTLDIKPVGGDTNFDVKSQAKLVKDGLKKLSDLPKSQQTAVEKELSSLTQEEAGSVKNEALTLIDELVNMDTGAITGLKNPLKYLPGGEAYQTEAKLKQLVGKLTLEARKLLKGSGQISDKESQMLEQSVAALSQKQSNKAFKQELLKLRTALSGAGATSTLDPEDEALINKYKK
jgi:hypothetical protein